MTIITSRSLSRTLDSETIHPLVISNQSKQFRYSKKWLCYCLVTNLGKLIAILRCFITVFSIFEHSHFDRSVLTLFISYYYSNGRKEMSNHCSTRWYCFLTISGHHSNSNNPLKTRLILAQRANSSNTSSVIQIFYHQIFISMLWRNFWQSFKKNVSEIFRATLICWKFKVALNPSYRFF